MKNYTAEELNSMSKDDIISALLSARKENADLNNELVDANNRVLLLEEKLRKALNKLFGPSSEHVAKEMDVCEQLSFFANEAEMWADIESSEEKKTTVAAHTRTSKRKNIIDMLPDNVPTETVDYYPESTECSNCGAQMIEFGTEVRKTLVIKPAQVSVRMEVFHKYKCEACTIDDENTIIAEPEKVATVLPGSYASPEAIAYIMTEKFVMASPLYRIEQELNRRNIMLTRQTMSNWFLDASKRWLIPIYKALLTELLKQKVLHADETPLQVLHEPGKKATSKSYMWLYRTSGCAEHQIVLYKYEEGRSAKYPKEFLSGFKGYLHTDGYSGYHSINGITVVGCLAHARRKFFDTIKSISKNDTASKSIAEEAVRRFDEITDLDKSYVNLTYEEKSKKRNEELKPKLDELLCWLKGCNIAPKFALGKAVTYLENQYQYILNIFKDGRLEFTNNRAERSIKPFVMGRKNWLFANTPSGASSSATVYSVIETAKENGLDPYKYLLWIFTEAPKQEGNNSNWAENFMPWKAPDSCRVPQKRAE